MHTAKHCPKILGKYTVPGLGNFTNINVIQMTECPGLKWLQNIYINCLTNIDTSQYQNFWNHLVAEKKITKNKIKKLQNKENKKSTTTLVQNLG